MLGKVRYYPSDSVAGDGVCLDDVCLNAHIMFHNKCP